MKQLRGAQLLAAFERVVMGMVEQASACGDEYVYNAKEIAGRLGVSRQTLHNRSKEIAEVLDRLCVGRGERQRPSRLIAQVRQLKEENAQLKREVKAMQEAFLHIFHSLYEHSIPGAALASAAIKEVSAKRGKCLVCGQLGEPLHKSPNGNVVSLRTK